MTGSILQLYHGVSLDHLHRAWVDRVGQQWPGFELILVLPVTGLVNLDRSLFFSRPSFLTAVKWVSTLFHLSRIVIMMK